MDNILSNNFYQTTRLHIGTHVARLFFLYTHIEESTNRILHILIKMRYKTDYPAIYFFIFNPNSPFAIAFHFDKALE